VTKVVPVPRGDPPLDAAYQKIESAAVAVNVTVPVPQCDPPFVVGGDVIVTVAITPERELLQPLPDAIA
jgi:hypothetical protein